MQLGILEGLAERHRGQVHQATGQLELVSVERARSFEEQHERAEQVVAADEGQGLGGGEASTGVADEPGPEVADLEVGVVQGEAGRQLAGGGQFEPAVIAHAQHGRGVRPDVLDGRMGEHGEDLSR